MADLTDADLNDAIRQMAADGEVQMTRPTQGATDYMSGAIQTGLALGQYYLTRRLDIDLASRVAGSQPAVQRMGTQALNADHLASVAVPQSADLTTKAVAAAGGVRLGNLLPWLVAGAALWWFMGAPKPSAG